MIRLLKTTRSLSTAFHSVRLVRTKATELEEMNPGARDRYNINAVLVDSVGIQANGLGRRVLRHLYALFIANFETSCPRS